MIRIRLAILLVLALLLGARPARACGAFPSETWVKAPPRLSLERTLIVWDSATKMQHFVRELRFAHAAGAFGFVVPTPTRPTVHPVEKSPFDQLEKSYPSAIVESSTLLGGMGFGQGFGRSATGGAAVPPPVQVLEQKRVGDFTAYVLVATDKDALSAWLDKHGFKTSEAGQAWMAGYVRLGFHFVALRYDGTKNADEALTSRTLRISFESELPFYPYREPADAPEQTARELALWVVSDVPLVPYSGVTHQSEWRLRRPFSEGVRSFPFVGDLEEGLGKELSSLAPRTHIVQTFGDYKQARHGWEDVVFVPLADCDAACRTAREKLLPLLDARLEAEPTVAPSAPSASSAPQPPTSGSANALSCAVGRHGSGAWWLLVAGGLWLRRRRWLATLPLAVLLLVACEHAAPAPAPSATPSLAAASAAPSASAGFAKVPEAFVAPRDVQARKQAVLDVLANRFDGYVPVWSVPIEGGMGGIRRERGEDDPFLGALEATGSCAEGLEAVVTIEADIDAKGVVKKTRAIGPLPRVVRECVEQRVADTVFGPVGGERTERAPLYFGDTSPQAMSVARAISSARGHFVAKGGVRLRITAVTVSKGLPIEVVQRILRQSYTRFVACHTRHAKSGPAELRVPLTLTIGKDGSVASAQATAKGSPEAGSCISKSLYSLSFLQPTPGPMQVSAELVFGGR